MAVDDRVLRQVHRTSSYRLPPAPRWAARRPATAAYSASYSETHASRPRFSTACRRPCRRSIVPAACTASAAPRTSPGSTRMPSHPLANDLAEGTPREGHDGRTGRLGLGRDQSEQFVGSGRTEDDPSRREPPPQLCPGDGLMEPDVRIPLISGAGWLARNPRRRPFRTGRSARRPTGRSRSPLPRPCRG